jgi:hypothetical protein
VDDSSDKPHTIAALKPTDVQSLVAGFTQPVAGTQGALEEHLQDELKEAMEATLSHFSALQADFETTRCVDGIWLKSCKRDDELVEDVMVVVGGDHHFWHAFAVDSKCPTSYNLIDNRLDQAVQDIFEAR